MYEREGQPATPVCDGWYEYKPWGRFKVVATGLRQGHQVVILLVNGSIVCWPRRRWDQFLGHRASLLCKAPPSPAGTPLASGKWQPIGSAFPQLVSVFIHSGKIYFDRRQ